MALNLDGTYNGLKNAVASWLHRNDSADYVDDLILLGEDRIYCEVRCREMETSFSTTISSGVLGGFPEPFLGIKDLWLQDGTVKRHLKQVPLSYLREMYNDTSDADDPEVYAVRGGTPVVEFGPYPGDADATCGGICWHRPTSHISSTVTGNTLFTGNQGLFLFAALAEAAPYLGQDVRVPMWEAKYQAMKAAINLRDDRCEFGDNLQMRIA
jgi:hypothetical protein